MIKKPVFWIIGAALLLGVLFGVFFAGPLLVSAHGTTPAVTASASATNSYCQQYLQDLAKRLNVPLATLEQDQKAAKEDILAQMVKDGKLTQAQADAIRQRLDARQVCNGTPRVQMDKRIVRLLVKKYMPTLLNGVASGLHLSASQLQTDLQGGQTLSQIASAHKVTTSQLSTLVLNAVQNTLDQARQTGDVTQTQETAFLQFLRTHLNQLDRLLDHSFGEA